MNELDALKGAYALIQNPERWTTHALARDAKGNGFSHPRSPQAVGWCAMGALVATTQINTEYIEAHRTPTRICKERYGGGIVFVNNGPDGHARICEMFRDAIAEAAPKGAPVATPELEHV